MKICILATDDKVAVVRERAATIPAFVRHTTMNIPLSPTGDAPPTHWFCTFDATDSMYQQIVALQQDSEVVQSEPDAFLTSRNLKVISVQKMVEAKRTERAAAAARAMVK
jgi:hypothetical protein